MLMWPMQAVSELQSSGSGLECELKFVRYAQSNKCKSASESSVSYASASLVLTAN